MKSGSTLSKERMKLEMNGFILSRTYQFAQRSIWVGPAANIVTLEETGWELMIVTYSWVETLQTLQIQQNVKC